MKRISVIISSLRPQALEATIDSMGIYKDLLEVVVISPWQPKFCDFVKYVPVAVPPEGKDPAERESKGELSLSKKINLGLKVAEGEYIIFHNDDLRFQLGWAPALLEHMQAKAQGEKPYMACFPVAFQGKIVARHTVFGLLYANHGCISQRHLKMIGGYLYDERMRTEYVDPDLSLRVWAAGGQVQICPGVVINVDTYTKLDPKKSDPLCKPYKIFWTAEDASKFFDLWFKHYFWLFFRNYGRLKSFLDVKDGVLPENQHRSGARTVFYKHFLKYMFFQMTFNGQKLKQVKRDMARLINRRWHSVDYQLPYSFKDIVVSNFAYLRHPIYESH